MILILTFRRLSGKRKIAYLSKHKQTHDCNGIFKLVKNSIILFDNVAASNSFYAT
jgi:hypothetical protein